MGYEFEWDPAKERTNRRKHGVSFDEATRLLIVAYAERGQRTRLISARRASPSEHRLYAEG